MISFRYIGRVVSDRRNWPIIIAGAALVFLGSQLFKAIGLESAIWIVALIIIISIAARSFLKTSLED